MKSHRWIFAALIAAACSGSAQAQSARAVNIGGAGRDPCATWLQDRDAATDASRQANERREEWISGFFSAVNFFNDQAGNLHGGIDDRDGMLGWIDNYCRTHPSDPLWVVAVDLVLDLKRNPRK